MKLYPLKTPVALLPCALILAWSALAGTGFLVLLGYKGTPGEQGNTLSQWPAESRIARVPDGFNLVVVLHPRCPCSRATVAELQHILARCQEKVHVHALVYRPSLAAENWEEGDILQSVKAIPGVSIHLDENGVESERFGGHTSGQVALFGLDGKLLFQGGITASRGHLGETPAHDALRSLLRGGSSEVQKTPVYGCPLCNSKCQREQT